MLLVSSPGDVAGRADPFVVVGTFAWSHFSIVAGL